MALLNELDAKPLTELQAKFVDAFMQCDENRECTRKRMGWKGVDRVANMLRSDRVQLELRLQRKDLRELAVASKEFDISKAKKMEVLWEIAKGGIERGFDKMGNSIMLNPQASTQAIRELNVMQGHHAPVQQEVTVTHETRTEKEIRGRIAELTAEFQQLTAIDGECEILSENEGVG